MIAFFTRTNFSFESVEVLLCAFEIHEFQVLKSGNTDGVSRKIPSLQILWPNNTFQRILAILNTEIHLPYSNFDSFDKLLAFSEKCSLRNPVRKSKQMAGIKSKRKKLQSHESKVKIV